MVCQLLPVNLPYYFTLTFVPFLCAFIAHLGGLGSSKQYKSLYSNQASGHPEFQTILDGWMH